MTYTGTEEHSERWLVDLTGKNRQRGQEVSSAPDWRGEEFVCPNPKCGKTFLRTDRRQRYCSPPCAAAAGAPARRLKRDAQLAQSMARERAASLVPIAFVDPQSEGIYLDPDFKEQLLALIRSLASVAS